MSNIKGNTADKEYAVKCDGFEETLTEKQQEQFYELENLVLTLTADQRKDLIELINLLDKVHNNK